MKLDGIYYPCWVGLKSLPFFNRPIRLNIFKIDFFKLSGWERKIAFNLINSTFFLQILKSHRRFYFAYFSSFALSFCPCHVLHFYSGIGYEDFPIIKNDYSMLLPSLHQQKKVFEKNHETRKWFSAVIGVQHPVELTAFLSSPQILFHNYFACWLFLFPGYFLY